MVWNPGKPLFGGRYIIEAKLGEGGVGITYLARNTLNQPRVIKTLRQEVLNNRVWKSRQEKLRQDFRHEAVRLAVCQHPHIVKIENIFDEGNLPCMVMEFIQGEDLGDRLKRSGILKEAEALLYIRQIGDALMVMHSKGLLHRDIKPRNIMLRMGKQEAVLIDFGIAREFIPDIIQRHTVYRTPGFAPPEQYQLEAPRGEYIDVYGLAATLYTLLTGVVPTSAEERIQNVDLQPPKQLNPNISDRTNQAILQGMAMRSQYRPQSVQDWLNLFTFDKTENLTRIRLKGNREQGTGNREQGTGNLNPSGRTIKPLTSSTQTTTFQANTTAPQSWQCVHTIKRHGGMVYAIAFTPDGQYLASGSSDNTIKMWETRTGKIHRRLGRWFSGHSDSVWDICFSPKQNILASASYDRTIKLWETTGKNSHTLTGHENWVNSVAFHPNGLLLASSSNDCTIKLWKTTTGKEIQTLASHTDSVLSVNFSPDGQYLVSGSADNTIKIWEVSTGKEIITLKSHSFFVNSVIFHPNGKTLASASSDRTIKLWHATTGKLIRTYKNHTDSVSSISFTPNGQILASASWDHTIKLWQTNTGKEIATLTGHCNYIRAIAFSPDGKTLVSASDDETIKIWEIQQI
ncbi:serine/threonine-protein kinase [Calothrix sp. PCC 6303]|uniref:serine/threonine-protein kinase n=1 Tax=Calothrix sp. PCC 6303 TaxID=1170562 RepID=UPI0002A03180|nr:serine/threonine-protein kinase [Calothrix sp. PCC 6303]AFY99149.1 WD-40 repeat-containing protein [Calothrix sp. PCC 6303]